jgi:epoxyqueuosine reductase
MPELRAPLTAAAVRAAAAQLGFDLCGVAPAAGFPELRFFREWIDEGLHGEMLYLERTADRRADVREILPSARSVIALGTVYDVDRPYSTEIASADAALISRYAWGDDYHLVIGRRLESLLAWMRGRHPEPFEARAYVDTGPVQERVYAQRAGLGWIGKNTCLINDALGSWMFLAEIVSSLELEPDAPALDQCGTCTLCLEACPTGAFVGPWVLDSTRCISYLTIELKGPIPEAARDRLGTRVYGCDVCQEVCPWNQSPARSADPAWAPRAAFDGRDLGRLWAMSDAELRAALTNSAMRRAGLVRLRRNLAVSLANTGSRSALELLARDRDEPSCRDSLVAEHVAWARRKLESTS